MKPRTELLQAIDLGFRAGVTQANEAPGYRRLSRAKVPAFYMRRSGRYWIIGREGAAVELGPLTTAELREIRDMIDAEFCGETDTPCETSNVLKVQDK